MVLEKPMTSRRPRILMLASYFPKPGNPLIGTWALDQAQALQRVGAEVQVISLTPWVPRWPGQSTGVRAYAACPADADWNGLRVYYPRWLHYPITAFERFYVANPLPWLRSAWSLCRRRVFVRAQAFRPDLIFAHHTAVNGWLALQLGKRLGIPFFSQDHAQWEIAACTAAPRRLELYRCVGEAAAGLIAVSEQMASDLRRLVPAAKISVIPNGANLPDSPGVPVNASQRPATFFSAGMFVRYKAFDLLLRAWAQLQKKHPNARLRIAGNGPEESSLRHLYHELGLKDSVTFLGYRTQREVQAEMAAARAFVLASWNETFGVVFLEAAAVGAPCIWARNAGVADVLVDGVHGIAVAPHDEASLVAAMEHFINEPETAGSMGQAAAHHVRTQLTWDATARRLLELMKPTTVPT